MTNRHFKFFLPIFFLAALFITSCSDDEETISSVEIENYTEDAVFRMQRHAMCGMRGCFEFVFPVTIVFPDGAEAEIESYEEMRDRIRSWKEENPDAEDRPSLQYPLDLLTEDGEIVTAESADDLKALTKECVREFVKSHKRLNNSCFRITFPINLELPNGDTLTIENGVQLKHQLRRWKHNFGEDSEKPQMVFPITVILKEDGSEMVIESKEDLAALKEECRS